MGKFKKVLSMGMVISMCMSVFPNVFAEETAKANTKSAIYVPLTVPEHKNLTIQGNAFDSIKMLTPLY